MCTYECPYTYLYIYRVNYNDQVNSPNIALFPVNCCAGATASDAAFQGQTLMSLDGLYPKKHPKTTEMHIIIKLVGIFFSIFLGFTIMMFLIGFPAVSPDFWPTLGQVLQ